MIGWMIPTLFGLCALLLSALVINLIYEADKNYAAEHTEDTVRQFEDIFLFISPQQMAMLARTGAVIVFFLTFFAVGDLGSPSGFIIGVVAGLLLAVPSLFFPRLLLKMLRKRRLERFNDQLVNALSGMSNALKAGFSIQQAFESVVKERQNPISQEFSVFLHQLRVGMKFEDALKEMDQRMQSDDLSLMIMSIEIARQTGGNLTEVFDRISETIRERRRIQGRIKSITAQGRMQGYVVGAMPFILGFALYLLDPQMMLRFLTSGVGLVCVAVVLVLEACGLFFIRKIVDIDV